MNANCYHVVAAIIYVSLTSTMWIMKIGMVICIIDFKNTNSQYTRNKRALALAVL